MYPRIEKKKSKLKIRIFNYIYEFKCNVYDLIKIVCSTEFVLAMKKVFHF